MLQLLGGSILAVGLLLLVQQQSGVHGDGVILVGMHGVVDEGHEEQDHAAHDEVHGVEHSLRDGCLIGHLTKLLAGYQIQRNRAGQTCMPDNEAGIGGGDEQGIVHRGDTAHHFLGQQGADDQAEAPVQPAADCGHKGGDQNSLLVGVAQAGHGPQSLLAGTGGGHGRTKHQHQSHLHGEGQQVPEASLGITPFCDDLNGAHARSAHGRHEYNQGQDDGEQERVGKPSVDDAHAAVCEFLKHSVTLLFFRTIVIFSST